MLNTIICWCGAFSFYVCFVYTDGSCCYFHFSNKINSGSSSRTNNNNVEHCSQFIASNCAFVHEEKFNENEIKTNQTESIKREKDRKKMYNADRKRREKNRVYKQVEQSRQTYNHIEMKRNKTISKLLKHMSAMRTNVEMV